MKKGLSLLLLVLLITLIAATPAFAKHDPTSITIGGTVTAVGGSTITIQTKTQKEITVNVTDSTVFMGWTVDGRVPITFDAVTVGDTANVRGVLEGGLYYADVVTVDVPLACALE